MRRSRFLVLLLALAGVVALLPLFAGVGRAGTPAYCVVTVNSTGDGLLIDGLVTLREAISFVTDDFEPFPVEKPQISGCPDDDDNPGAGRPDIITFNINLFQPFLPQTIALTGSLPAMHTGQDTIDGSAAGVIVDGGSDTLDPCFGITSDGNAIFGLEIYDCWVGVLIDGTGGSASGNAIGSGAPSYGNVISDNRTGVRILGGGATGNVVQGNRIGTNADGTAARGNMQGVEISDAPGNYVGTAPAPAGAGARPPVEGDSQGNLISGNVDPDTGSFGAGVVISNSATPGESSGNVVQGNRIGTNAAGTGAIANVEGVAIAGALDNVIGGTTSAARNIVSGNERYGVLIHGDDILPATGNIVQGNYIGTNAGGSAALGNGQFGVWIWGADGNTIGGTAPGAGNVISGNGSNGVVIEAHTGGDASGNLLQGNYIGTNPAGTAAIPNGGAGVVIDGAPGNYVGGMGPGGASAPAGAFAGAGNVISGNASTGVYIHGTDAIDDHVESNLIGTNAAGDAALPNGGDGVLILDASANYVGGDAPGQGNVISGNDLIGVEICCGTAVGDYILGNLVGTNASGESPIPNSEGGVLVRGDFNIVGGDTSGARNVISGNDKFGLSIEEGATGNSVRGNYIGTNASGAGALPNPVGIQVLDSDGNAIGGADGGEGNLVAFNGGYGVGVDSLSQDVTVSGNSIHSNAGIGIDLGKDDVTLNDVGDADAGANDRQNFPDLTTASGDPVAVEGTLNSTASTEFRIEFFASVSCDPVGFGEGGTYLSAIEVTTDGAGDASFSDTVGSGLAGQFITATATDPVGNTSEFSQCIEVTGGATPTPSPTPGLDTPTPPPSATPTPTPAPGLMGDVDCDDDVDTVDALHVLRDAAGMSTSAGCLSRGDVQCDGDRDTVDALGILRFVAGLPPIVTEVGCPRVGTPV